jgi:hypothetical protein
MMFCSKCGEQLNEIAIFCTKCGSKIANNNSGDGQQTIQSNYSTGIQTLSEISKKNKLMSLKVLSIIGFVLFPLGLFFAFPTTDFLSSSFIWAFFILIYWYAIAYSIVTLVKGIKYTLKITKVMAILGIIIWFILSVSIVIIFFINFLAAIDNEYWRIPVVLTVLNILGLAYAIAFSIVVFLQSRKKVANNVSNDVQQTNNSSEAQTVTDVSKRNKLLSLRVLSIISLVSKNKTLFIISLFLFLYVVFSFIYFAKLRTTIIYQETQLARLLGNSYVPNVNTTTLNLKSDELDAQVGYNIVQRIIDTSLVSVQQINDYEEKMNICDNVIRSINEFIITSKDIYLNNMAEISRSEWYFKKSEYQSVLDSLTDDLHEKLFDKAVSVSYGRHPLSNIENIDLLNSRKTKNKRFIYYEMFYDVRMVGGFFRSSIYKFTILVNGYIDMSDDSTGVYDDVIVDE